MQRKVRHFIDDEFCKRLRLRQVSRFFQGARHQEAHLAKPCAMQKLTELKYTHPSNNLAAMRPSAIAPAQRTINGFNGPLLADMGRVRFAKTMSLKSPY